MGAKAQSARNYIFNRQPKREAVPTPFWPDLEGSVFLQDVPSDEIMSIQDDATSNGAVDNAKAGAAMICKALVIKEDDGTWSNVFVYPDDLTQVAHLGTSLLLPVMNQANTFFGFDAKTVEAAKNGSGPMQSNSIGIGSSVQEAVIIP